LNNEKTFDSVIKISCFCVFVGRA